MHCVHQAILCVELLLLNCCCCRRRRRHHHRRRHNVMSNGSEENTMPSLPHTLLPRLSSSSFECPRPLVLCVFLSLLFAPLFKPWGGTAESLSATVCFKGEKRTEREREKEYRLVSERERERRRDEKIRGPTLKEADCLGSSHASPVGMHERRGE